MTRLSDLMDLHEVTVAITAGLIRARPHPQDPRLFILNYTEKAQYDKVWNEVTTQCRGLIVQMTGDGDGVVVARPWPKFFNWGELDGASEDILDAPAVVQDKMDGSLGILYCAPDGDWAIATRGSFESEQAQHATALYRERYEDYWAPRPGFTYLFEIVYPENRIVLDYGDLDDLVLLDVVDNETGRGLQFASTAGGWPGAMTRRMEAGTLREALALPMRPNAEGVVVTLESTGAKIKIKQEDYVRLHKLVTGLNERAVWEHLAANHGRIDQLLMVIPDEFHEWTQKVADGFLEAFEALQGRATAAYYDIDDLFLTIWEPGTEDIHDPTHRRWFAEQAKQHGDLTPLLFQMLDGRDISDAIWKTLRPRGDTKSLLNRSEDNS